MFTARSEWQWYDILVTHTRPTWLGWMFGGRLRQWTIVRKDSKWGAWEIAGKPATNVPVTLAIGKTVSASARNLTIDFTVEEDGRLRVYWINASLNNIDETHHLDPVY